MKLLGGQKLEKVIKSYIKSPEKYIMESGKIWHHSDTTKIRPAVLRQIGHLPDKCIQNKNLNSVHSADLNNIISTSQIWPQFGPQKSDKKEITSEKVHIRKSESFY